MMCIRISSAKYKNRFFLAFFLLLFMTACSSDIKNSTNLTQSISTPIPADDWQVQWLKGQPCSIPCWEGITPGVTSLTEAKNILGKNPVFSDVRLTIYENAGYVSWRWSNLEKGYGDLYTEGKNVQPQNPVQVVRPHYNRNFTLREIIQVFGEPSHLFLYGGQPNLTDSKGSNIYSITFYYQDKGIALEKKGTVGKFVITSDLSFENIYFFTPKTDGRQISSVPESAVTAWQGFKSFDFYCNLVGTSNCN